MLEVDHDDNDDHHQRDDNDDGMMILVAVDAAGRPKDHGDGDKEFAKHVGVQFHTETEFFKTKHAPQ